MDNYCIKAQGFLQQAEIQVTEIENKLANIDKTFAEACEFYLIDKSDEKAQNSQEFFKFFTALFDQVVKSMPKEEKKKKEPVSNTVGKKFVDLKK